MNTNEYRSRTIAVSRSGLGKTKHPERTVIRPEVIVYVSYPPYIRSIASRYLVQGFTPKSARRSIPNRNGVDQHSSGEARPIHQKEAGGRVWSVGHELENRRGCTVIHCEFVAAVAFHFPHSEARFRAVESCCVTGDADDVRRGVL